MRCPDPRLFRRLVSKSRALVVSTFWFKLFPFLVWWREINRLTFRADAMAGVTGAIVVLPQAVAFATIAGLPPQYGLYAAMVPAIVAALYGSSRHLVSGPTTAASLVLFTSLSAFAEPGTSAFVTYAITLTFMVGVIELALGAARLGILVNFISHSVIVGFTAGAAILIASNQAKNFLGLSVPGSLQVIEVLQYIYYNLAEIHSFTLLVGVVTLVVALYVRLRRRRLPYMVVALVAGTALASLLNYMLYTRLGLDPEIAVVGEVPGGLPPFSSPDFSFSTLTQLAPIAFAVTLFALTEAVSIARLLAARSGQYIDGNQEFIGQGLSNIVGSFVSSYVATGSFNRSAINFDSGAQTPLAAMVAGGLLIPIVLLVAPLLAYIPTAGMAAILFVVAWGLLDFSAIAKIIRSSGAESIVLWSTFFATLFLQLEFAILLGVFLSLVIYLLSASQPRVLKRMPDPRLPRRRFSTDAKLPECPQLSIVRIDGALFFGAVSYVAERLRIIAKRNPEQTHMLLLSRGINTLDVAGAEMIEAEAVQRARKGGALYMHSLKEQPLRMLRRGGYLERIGEHNIFDSKGDAISGIFDRLDKEICKTCTRRIFVECQTVEPPEAVAGASTVPDSGTPRTRT
jgi:SulP family sulfate permease